MLITCSQASYLPAGTSKRGRDGRERHNPALIRIYDVNIGHRADVLEHIPLHRMRGIGRGSLDMLWGWGWPLCTLAGGGLPLRRLA